MIALNGCRSCKVEKSCCSINSKCCQQMTDAGKCPLETSRIEPKVFDRGWKEKIVFSDNGDMRYGPIYFTDYSEKDINDDKVIKTWTRQDACSIFTDPFVFIGQLAALPCKAIKPPPTAKTISRGNIKWEMPEYVWGLK